MRCKIGLCSILHLASRAEQRALPMHELCWCSVRLAHGVGEEAPPAPRELWLVIDGSGSMGGAPEVQARDAASFFVKDLPQGQGALQPRLKPPAEVSFDLLPASQQTVHTKLSSRCTASQGS